MFQNHQNQGGMFSPLCRRTDVSGFGRLNGSVWIPTGHPDHCTDRLHSLGSRLSEEEFGLVDTQRHMLAVLVVTFRQAVVVNMLAY